MLLRLYATTHSRKLFRAEQSKLQRSACAICGAVTKLVIDHNHKSGYMRGLLCNKHNMALGLFDDNPAMLEKALNYLASHEQKEIEFRSKKELINKLLDDTSFPSDRARAREYAKLLGCSESAAVSAVRRSSYKRKRQQMSTDSMHQM